MKKNLNISNEVLMKLDYKHTHILKKFTNDNGKIIPQRVKICQDLFILKLLRQLNKQGFYL